ncbi:GNAT family N-acetyltransferase [Tropicimonas sp.]|uniref:GNAT family N-acetyltransferase n=1 Tax=Tropicimonas sp. TaxID=2067044 RepID=UPI003A8C3BA9
MIERLETGRLILRRPAIEDRPAYIAYYASDWRATHGPVLAAGSARPRFNAILDHWRQNGYGRFVVELKDRPGEALGLFGPHFPDSYPEQELTGQIWRRDVLGLDIGYEALLITRSHAYENLGWTGAVTYIHSENAPAIRLARRLGAAIDPHAFKPAVLDTHDAWRHPVQGAALMTARRNAARRRQSGRQTAATIPTIHTPRLVLRPPRLDDFEPYAAFLASDRARGMSGPHNRATAWSWFTNDIAHWQLFGFGGLIIEHDGAPAGQVSITRGLDFPEPELGWFLFEGQEGKGLATEAALAMRDHAYTELGLETLVSYCAPDNLQSIALAERLGCRPDPDAPRPEGATYRVYRHPAPDTDGNPGSYA